MTDDNQDVQEVWQADAHRWGEGKAHGLNPDDPTKTLCKKDISTIAGKPSHGWVTCGACKASVKAEANRQVRMEEWEQRKAELEVQRAEAQALRDAESAAWWTRFHDYQRSDAWKAKAAVVVHRANGICEACGVQRATRIYRRSWAHVFHEPLFELVAVCAACFTDLQDSTPHAPRNSDQ